ncbi:hypothetical protein QR685DRAFT_201410 [Neurospora intermedia]|uniref:Isochorismatase-like domain-containing protein n=1 Tax=Neurospora intermedia TaxID=5142 RepID=A0ABR3DFB1_NEUIN
MPLEEILRSQNIDAVVISGLTLSGVVLSTVYRLFDLDYKVFVISNNVLDLPAGGHGSEVSQLVLKTLAPAQNKSAGNHD